MNGGNRKTRFPISKIPRFLDRRTGDSTQTVDAPDRELPRIYRLYLTEVCAIRAVKLRKLQNFIFNSITDSLQKSFSRVYRTDPSPTASIS
jgi:hypothetical protein